MIYKLYYDESDVYSNINGIAPNSPRAKSLESTVKIVILGDYMVGKTSFVRRICQDQFKESHDNATSVEHNETFVKVRNGKDIKVELYDTPGLEHLKLDTDTVCHTCHGAIILYDVTEPYSFKGVQQHLDKLRRQLPPDGEILLIGAKTDLTGERKVTFKEADEFAAKRSLSLFEISSKTNINVQNALNELVQRIVDRRQIGTFDPATMIISDSVEKSKISPMWSLFCCWVY